MTLNFLFVSNCDFIGSLSFIIVKSQDIFIFHFDFLSFFRNSMILQKQTNMKVLNREVPCILKKFQTAMNLGAHLDILCMKLRTDLRIQVLLWNSLTHYHTISHFDTLEVYSYEKHCEKRRLQAISLFLTMFSTLYIYFPVQKYIKMSPAICVSMDQSKILLSGYGLPYSYSLLSSFWL